jgi:hypothetical protein
VLGPSHVINVDGLSITEPSGWSEVTYPPGYFATSTTLRGPADSFVDIVAGQAGQQIDPATLATDLRNDALPFGEGEEIHRSTVREVSLPIGPADEADVTLDERPGELVLFSTDDRTYGMFFMSAGSDKATADFTKILDSVGR